MSEKNNVTDLPGFRPMRERMGDDFIEVMREVDLLNQEWVDAILAMGSERWDVQLLARLTEHFLHCQREQIRVSRIAVPVQMRWWVADNPSVAASAAQLRVSAGIESLWQEEIARFSVSVVPIHRQRQAPFLDTSYAQAMRTYLSSWHEEATQEPQHSYGMLFFLIPYFTAVQSVLPHSQSNHHIEEHLPAAETFQYGTMKLLTRGPRGLCGSFYKPLDRFTAVRLRTFFSDRVCREFNRAILDGRLS